MNSKRIHNNGSLQRLLKRCSLPRSASVKEDFKRIYSFVLRSSGFGRVSISEIESAKKLVRRLIKKRGMLDIRAFARVPLTKKPAEVRMGKGKGSKVVDKIVPIVPGKNLLQISGVSIAFAFKALSQAAVKFSVATRVVSIRY